MNLRSLTALAMLSFATSTLAHDPALHEHEAPKAKPTTCAQYADREAYSNDLTDPEPVPRGTDYACLVESSVPIVVQHTRLDSRQPANALLSTIAYAGR